jgi:hypothetical protein
MSLPALSKADRLLGSIVLLGAALVALVIWLVKPPETTGGLVRQPSTFFNAGYGTKAAYLVLDRLGYPVTRLRRPLGDDALDGIGILVVLKPLLGLRPYELTDLDAWVREGHVLVVVPGSCVADAFGVKDHPGHVKSKEMDEEDKHSAAGEQLGAFFEQWFRIEDAGGDDEKKPEDSSKTEQADAGATIDPGEPICAGIHQLTARAHRRFAKSPLKGSLANSAAEPFWSDRLGTIGLRIRLGEGTIIALADPFPFSNLGIGEADNGLLLANLAREFSKVSPGKIAFDEYHLGFAARDWSPLAMMKLILAGPWQGAMAQAILVGLLALYAGAVRFGSPRDIVRKPRRQHREFAEAAGGLYDEGGATLLAAATLYRYYRDRLCRTLHLDPHVDNSRISQAVHDRSGRDIAAILDRARDAASNRVTRQELLVVTKNFHRAVEALDHGP